jgi:molybdenum cofactor cytidylyltransferase
MALEDANLAAHSAHAAVDAGLDPVIVVLGHGTENVEQALAGLPVRCVFNPEFAAGQSSSVRKGLEALPSRTGAAVFLPADQSFITSGMIRKIVEAHRRTLAPACVAIFEEKKGNPVLFDKTVFKELAELRGDKGLPAFLDKYAAEVISVA